MKLTTLRSTLQTLAPRLKPVTTLSDQRMAGRALQARRLRLWSADPHCVACGCLTAWPRGFEVDHTVRLEDGGPDTDENCQILCVSWDAQGRKQGCHAEKTRDEARATP